jgi:hypothetical protein
LQSKSLLPRTRSGSEKEGLRRLKQRQMTVQNSALNLELPELNKLNNRLRTTFDIQLLHHIRDVVADRFLADKQLLRNVAGRFILYEQFEDFAFPISE